MTRLLTARVVAEQFDVSIETVLRWVRRDELPAIRLPSGQIRFREAELEEWLEQRSIGVVDHRSLQSVGEES